MKKIYFIAVALIAGAIILFTQAAKDVSTYATFEEASKDGGKVKIAAQLSKNKEMVFDPVKDPNRFTFFAKDANGQEHKVVLLAAKPQDFEMSEQVVVTGKMQGEEFIASDLLMKCPSKYKDEELFVKGEVKQ